VLFRSKYFTEAYDIYRRADAKREIAVVYHRFGQLQFARQNFNEALTWFVQAQQTAVEANVEYYIMSLSWQGRIYIRQQRWTEAQSFFEQAIERAQKVADNYQKVENLIYMAECLTAQNQEDRSQQLLAEAEQNAHERSYYDLLGQIEYRRGETLYHTQEFRKAFQHFVAYCYYMTRYNYSEYSIAVQRVIDALIGAIDKNAEAILKDIELYWEQHQLKKEYPELIVACEGVRELL